MAICKYYLQGTCRYGNKCRFEHVSPDSGDNDRGRYNSPERGSYSRGGYQSRNDDSSYRYASNDYQNKKGGRGDNDWYQEGQSQRGYENDRRHQRGQYDDSYRQRANYDQSDAYHYNVNDNQRTKSRHDDTYQHQGSQVNEYREGRRYPNQAGRADDRNTRPQTKLDETEEIISLIAEEMINWETSQMWPFSCFTFMREACSIPGFDDISMEEARFHAYDCKATGKTADYLKWMNSMIREYAIKRQQLQNPSGSTRSALIRLIGEEIDLEKAGNRGGTAVGERYSAASVTVTNWAGGARDGRDGVGASTMSGGSFGGFAPAANAFGFSGQIGFGAASTGTQHLSNSAQSTSRTVETHPASSFGFSTIAGGVGESRPMMTAAAQPSTSGFVSHQPSIPAHSTQVTNSRSTFSQQIRFDASSAASAAVVQGGSASSQIYTPVEQLSSEERSQFESAKFTLGNIPVRPPPQLYV